MALCPLAAGLLPGFEGRDGRRATNSATAGRERPVPPHGPPAECFHTDGEVEYLIIELVDFAYARAAIERALAENIALSWRLHRD